MQLGNNYSRKITADINVQLTRRRTPLFLQMQKLQIEKARTSKALSSTSACEPVDDKGLVGKAEERKKIHKNMKFDFAPQKSCNFC